MVKRNVTYKNFDDVEVTDTMYFNLTEAELLDIELKYGGDVSKKMELMQDRKDFRGLVEIIRDFIVTAYGERTEDGRFVKNAMIRDAFTSTGAYSALLLEMLNNFDALSNFMLSLFPSDVRTKIEQQIAEKKNEPVTAPVEVK